MESRGSCCTKQHFINDGSMKIVHRLYFKRLYYKYVLFPTKLTCVECISVFCSAVLSCMTTVFPPNSGHLIVSNSQALLETRFLKYSPYFTTLQNTISNLQFPNLVDCQAHLGFHPHCFNWWSIWLITEIFVYCHTNL